MLRDKKFWLGLIVSLFFLFLVFRGQRLDLVWGALQQANYLALLPALVFYFAGVAVRTFRWQILLRPLMPRSNGLRLFEVVVIGYMANDVLPARLGEVVRAFVLDRREKVTKSATLGTIVVERIFDGITMVGFIAFAALFIRLDPELDNLLRVGGILFFIGFVVFIFLAVSPTRITRLIDLLLGSGPLGAVVPESIRRRAHKVSASFIAGLQSLRSGRAVVGVLGTSILAWLLETTMYWIIGEYGFNLGLPFVAYMITTAAANLSTLVPSTPGYIGVFEGAAMAVLVGAVPRGSGPVVELCAGPPRGALFPGHHLGHHLHVPREHLVERPGPTRKRRIQRPPDHRGRRSERPPHVGRPPRAGRPPAIQSITVRQA